MNTEIEIENAIADSIETNSIVRVVVDDIAAALAAVSAASDDCDSAVEDDGGLDVWGTESGSDFRLLIRAK